jgi:nicotinamide riboside transporter PnuC
MFEWLLTALSIIGTLYNLQKRAAGWIIWTISNAGWIMSFTMKGLPAEATLFSVYLVLSVYGIFKWRQPRSQKKTAGAA